jgi:hypothetical protein
VAAFSSDAVEVLVIVVVVGGVVVGVSVVCWAQSLKALSLKRVLEVVPGTAERVETSPSGQCRSVSYAALKPTAEREAVCDGGSCSRMFTIAMSS